MPSSSTGIFFTNKVEDSRELNIFNFRNFYNGAGVAIGDINNDGKPDIFFTSNQGSNKLFLNRGAFRFEDATEAAGIKDEGKWYTGVTMVDVNADGWLDIYVCNSGKLGMNKPNDLYINQGDGTFKEEAARYGLADNGLSTHAAFFDYDHDGDLDCFVLNNSPRSIESFGYNKSIRQLRDTLNGDRFYRNDLDRFTDVSAEAGIYGSEIGFGLGITVGDLDNDGWEDMYVSNDFFERDYLYMNNRNGTFREVINDAVGHISQGSMGSDMADINNDGFLDIFTTEMLPEQDYKLKTTIKFDDYDVQNARLKNDFHHQFTSNCLQLNNGDGSFSEIAQLAGVDATGWSWGALSFDFDNDGWRDIFVCNGLNKDLTDQDFLEFFGSEEVRNKVAQGGFNFQDILDKMPSNKVPNYAFLNLRNLQFKNVTDSLGFSTPSFSNGAAYGDLDNDGDLDLVINNVNMEAFVYRNNASGNGNHYLQIKLQGNAPNLFGTGSRVNVFTGNGSQILEQMPARGFQSTVDNVLHFGLGDSPVVDSVTIRWPDSRVQTIKNIAADTVLTLFQKNSSAPDGAPVKTFLPLFEAGDLGVQLVHHENQYIDFDNERLIPKMLSTEGPCLAVADLNGDGWEDFFLGNSSGDTARILLQTKEGKFTIRPTKDFITDKYFETTAALFADIDEDGDRDLLLASGGNQAPLGSPYYQLRLYSNDGRANFSRDSSFHINMLVNASCIVLDDFDKDGKKDIFIGARSIPGKYGVPPESILLKNKGAGEFVIAQHLPLGMVTDARVADIDNDGSPELVVVGDWMPVTILHYTDGELRVKTKLDNSAGWWNCVEVDDIDNDGDIDILAGNAGLNSRIRATPDRPAKLYVGDLDQNGQVECVPVYFKSDGRAYPYFMKGELQQQIPSLRKQFLYFADYAGKSMEEVFTAEQLKNSSVLNVVETRSCVFRNEGKGSFTIQPLPLRAQFSYIFSFCISDFNRDGQKDLFTAGNFYGLKPQAGRFDASYGTTLLGRNGSFEYRPNSGIGVNGEVRDARSIMIHGHPLILVGVNNEAVEIFRQKFY